MIYALLRAMAGIALRWYYRAIDAEGLERVPRRGPLLVVVNHPNALVDALLVGWLLPRRLMLTAKATLFGNRIAAALLRWLGVLPLRRASDEGARPEGAPARILDPKRNAETFRAVSDCLRNGGAVLIFPEGKTHDEPELAPLRTGAARIALEARRAGVRGLEVIPVGLTFERKEAPRSRAFAQVGEPIAMDRWSASEPGAEVDELTAEMDRRLRAVTLNFPSPDDASRATALAASLARLFAERPEVSAGARPLGDEVALARRVDAASRALAAGDDALRGRVDSFLARLGEFERRLARERLGVTDLPISTATLPGARFVAREGAVLALAGPVAVWGAINHWLPFNAARTVAMRRIESNADPAMRTIVAGLVLVLAFYALQATLVGAALGWWWALVYVVSLPIAADVNFAMQARLARVTRRARTYLRFRRDPSLRAHLRDELAWLRREALELAGVLEAERQPAR